MNYVASLIKFVFMITIVLGDDCPYKECYCSNIEIVCQYSLLNAVPQKLVNTNQFKRSLNLNANNITTITTGSLPVNLSGISLQENPIEAIDDTAFDESIYTLHSLSFAGARFTQIPQAVFHLKALKSLDIEETNILVWNEDGMRRFGSTMETLTLDAVGLTSWPTWIKSMTNLSKLTISECFIPIIPDDALDMVANTLTYLDLSNTSLTALPKSMSNLTVLSSLFLNDNKIVDVTWLPQSSPINSLYLNDNKITNSQKLSNALRYFSSTLEEFNIDGNSLTSIPELSFSTLVLYLNFANNHISDANSGSFPPNLTELNINNNLLVSIPSTMNNIQFLSQLFITSNNVKFVQGSFIPASVSVLELSFNLISQLTRSSFPYNSSLTTLTLNNNPLFTISSDAFNNLPLLTQLSFHNTKLTRLPLALISLTKLNYLDVSDNADLVCTCQEQSLRPFIKSIGPDDVRGDCGMTSVYFFLTTLSPECSQVL